MRHLAAIALTITLGACATIEHTTSIKQKVDSILMAGPGDLVLRIDRERNLENAFGKSDIFGRKTKEGFTELRFAGVEPTGEVVLVRKDVQIMTNETTMSRTPFATTTGRSNTSVTGSVSTYGNTAQVRGSGTTNYSSTTLVPQKDFHIIVPSDAVAVRLAPSEKRLPISGYIIEIISASQNSLEYKVSRPD